MEPTRWKFAASLIALVLFLVGRNLDLADWGVSLLIALIVSQFLIWFPDELGSVTGIGASRRRRGVDKESPGCAVSGLGWLMLLLLPVFYVVVVRAMAGR